MKEVWEDIYRKVIDKNNKFNTVKIDEIIKGLWKCTKEDLI